MATLYHQVWIDAPASTLYAAISSENGIGSWWDRPTATAAEDNLVWEFRPAPEHGVLRMKVLERIVNQRVVWQCMSTHPDSSPASAWTGTQVIFEITERNQRTILDFRHSGGDDGSAYLGFCNYQWGMALQKLKNICEAQSS